ncbi:Double-strand break repair protein AddB [Parvibaculum lavamentivorans DS-1]|uniref:Double-strand break repair protein AddB n=1 Tax=Parvibaculum lavamentivorans (strain DS-1 / DSM 13023 / NCIMB 13966) TaxID=402881 RepID=A7HPC7_PARL1|nr:double-strand break repair protein AddB [Parvibaculum lavamentivorans]ABS61760.1 Double-strand break repair protein AddB [Parvibaculum lavamentivorans DS-1]
MRADSLNLFTMPPGTPFLERLAATLLDDPSLGGRFKGSPELAEITILLPTRRSVRALGEAFLRAGAGAPLLLPSIRTLGDVDEEDLILDPRGLGREALELPPAMPALERQLRLARMIVEGQGGDETRALALAADLGHFLDMVLTEGADLTRLADLVPQDFADHWQITIDFLKVLTARWPEELARLGHMEQAERRNLLLRAQAEAWTAAPPPGPVIAAGSTGSIPATAALLGVVAHLPMGAVVLPALDLDLDEESWNIIGKPGTASHPQYGMKKLLAHLRATRADVGIWPGAERSAALRSRGRLLSEALRPAETTERWLGRLGALDGDVKDGLKGLALIEAPSERDEAGAVALLMRDVLERPGKTAALVTPDRKLARRVAMELRRWKIDVNDSGGEPLAKTAPVAFLRLVANMVTEDLAPVPLLACLKHPLAAAGEEPAKFRARVRRLEMHLLRGPRPAPGLDGLRAACRALEDKPGDSGEISILLDKIERSIAPLLNAATKKGTATSIVEAHVEAAERLAASATETGAERLWKGEAGEAAADFIRELMEATPAFGDIDPRFYPHFFDVLLSGRVLRPRWGRHSRLFIWGPLEARLQHADRMILGGLNEGTWPAEANIDPWLNRPMRATMGLEPPERRIGLAAHDFAEGASAGEAFLTRALKVEGAPTVASRWWLRLASLLQGLEQEEAVSAPQWWQWAHKLDEPAKVLTPLRPRPVPPLEARPQRFSVTEIETLIRDPYAIYARKILGLKVLDPLDADIAAAERGTIIHEALEKFVEAYPRDLPENALQELINVGEEAFRQAIGRPGVAAFWWPRFLRIAKWIVDYEQEERAGLRHIHAETRGEILIAELAQPVVLSGKADRIDEREDGMVNIVDYKTGTVPSIKQVEIGLTPQLPLEAAMMARGGFRTKDGAPIPPAKAASLIYLRLTGGETAGEVRAIPDEGADLADNTYAWLVDLLRQYEAETTPYLSRPRPMFWGRYGDYDHLARVKEWSAAGGDGE